MPKIPDMIKHRGNITAMPSMSEKRLQDLVENIPEVFWIFDWEKQQLSYLSHACEAIWDRTTHELLEDKGAWASSIHPADQENAIQSFQEIHQKGQGAHEYRIVRSDNSVRWISSRGSAVYGEDGSTIQIVGLAADITERKRHEIIQNAQYNIATAMVTSTRQETLFQKIHSELAQLLETEYLRLALLNRDGGLLYSTVNSGEKNNRPLEWKVDSSPGGQVIRGKTSILLKKEELRSLIQRGAIEEFTPLPQAWLGIPVIVAEQVAGVIITESHQSPDHYDQPLIRLLEETARNIGNFLARMENEAERERLSAAIEQSAESVVITDTEGIIRYVNPAFERISGYTRGEVLGQSTAIIASGKHDETFYTELWDTISNGRVWYGKTINRAKDGNLFIEESTISPVFDADGTITNYVAAKRDITREQELVQQFHQAQKMESVGRLAGGIAHDFNNMLSVIIGYSEFGLKRLTPDDDLYPELKEIHNAGLRSAELTTQLLAFARKQAITPRPLNINKVVGDMLNMLRRLIGEEIDLTWSPGSTLNHIFADPTQIDQILANLCINARDSIAGTGKIRIKTKNITLDTAYCQVHPYAKPGNYVMLAIKDDGCGMSQETLANIFEPFFTTKPQGEGTGLGLSTVYGIVKQNEGVVTAESEPGRGTTISTYFPCYCPQVLSKEIEKDAAVSPGHGEYILLAEDEPAILKFIQSMLEDIGYSVIGANSPHQALRLARDFKDQIDLLITDVVMPTMNGRELAEKIHSFCPEMNVLFISGYPSNILDQHGILEEGVNFIAKPFSLSALAEKVHHVLNQERLPRMNR